MKVQKTTIIALAAAGVLCAGLSVAQEQISQTYPILGGGKEHQPAYGEIENFTILGYSDLNGWDRPTEIRVDAAGKYAYMASNPPPVDGKNAGGTIADVSDPKNIKVVAHVLNGPTEHSQYADLVGNTFVLNQEQMRVRDRSLRGQGTYNPGIQLYDVTDPTKPVKKAYFKTDEPGGGREGVHGFWTQDHPTAGKLAFLAATKEGYFGNILMIVDINDADNPKEIGRWWYPGTCEKCGEKPEANWIKNDNGGRLGLPNILVSLHDITTYKNRAYLSYRDQGVIILDITDPKKPGFISQIKWTPPVEANTHSVGLVFPKSGGDVPELMVVTDEINRICPWGYMHIIDIREEKHPNKISTFRLPLNKFCPADRAGRDFGVHDVQRLIRGNIVFSSWQSSGFWAIDISDPYAPKAAGHFVPPPFKRGGLDYSAADDVFQHENGLIYMTSNEPGGGLWIARYTPGVKGKVSWNPDQKSVTQTNDVASR
jgi:hypothetical protein